MSSLLTTRLRRVSAALAGLAVAGLAAALLATPPAQAAPAGLELVAVKHSLLGTHYWYRQTANGYGVLGGYYAEHVDSRTGKKVVEDGRRSVSALKRTEPAIDHDSAVSTATKRTPGAVRGSELVVVPGAGSTLAWSVTTESDRGSSRTLVDAGTGAVLRVESLVKHADGTGKVFVPNPVVALQNETLADKNNTDYAALSAAYKTVPLTQLNNSGTLRGTYAYDANTGTALARNAARNFLYTRNQTGFEQTMAYYAITHTQEYIHSLGFTDVNSEAQKFKTTGLTDDNSFYDPSADRITYGTGGVDDAEDAEVIWHEYGHAIQDAQVPGFGDGNEAGAIGEGFGDYWAFQMSSETSKDTAKMPLACIADWDATSYTTTTPHCLRRVDGTKTYPGDIQGEVHADGEIWSRALFDIYGQLGRTNANKVILESQFNYVPNTSFKSAAEKVVAAAQSLLGAAAATSCQNAFHARGIL